MRTDVLKDISLIRRKCLSVIKCRVDFVQQSLSDVTHIISLNRGWKTGMRREEEDAEEEDENSPETTHEPRS